MKNNKKRIKLFILCLALLILCIPIKYNYKDGGQSLIGRFCIFIRNTTNLLMMIRII